MWDLPFWGNISTCSCMPVCPSVVRWHHCHEAVCLWGEAKLPFLLNISLYVCAIFKTIFPGLCAIFWFETDKGLLAYCLYIKAGKKCSSSSYATDSFSQHLDFLFGNDFYLGWKEVGTELVFSKRMSVRMDFVSEILNLFAGSLMRWQPWHGLCGGQGYKQHDWIETPEWLELCMKARCCNPLSKLVTCEWEKLEQLVWSSQACYIWWPPDGQTVQPQGQQLYSK